MEAMAVYGKKIGYGEGAVWTVGRKFGGTNRNAEQQPDAGSRHVVRTHQCCVAKIQRHLHELRTEPQCVFVFS